MPQTFDAVLQALRPGVDYSNPDGTLANVKWASGVSAPTQQEFDAKASQLVIPSIVSAAQMIRALDKMGLLTQVQGAVSASGGLTLALWQHTPNFHRSDPLIAQVAAALGKTSADIDALFITAAQL